MANMTSEGFYITKSGRKYSKPPGRPLRNGPTNPEMVLKVVFMRDIENKRWREIVEELGLSRQALFLLHKKWSVWARIELTRTGYTDHKELQDGAA